MQLRLIAVPETEGAEAPGLREGPRRITRGIAGRREAPAIRVERVEVPATMPGPTGRYRQVREAAEAVAARVVAARRQGELPVVVGGDHSIALGTAAGLRRTTAGRIGLIWIDAHPDLHTPETTISGRIHGMVLAAIAGFGHPLLVGLPPAGAKISTTEIALLGIRDIEPGERAFLAAHPELQMIGVPALRELGIGAVVESLVRRWHDAAAVCLSFDLDVVDPDEAPGVTTPVPGGITRAEAIALVGGLAARLPIGAVDLVEFVPARDDGRTLDLAVAVVDTVRRAQAASTVGRAEPAA